MKRIILIAIALTVIFSGNGYAYDKRDGNDATLYDEPTCREFLEGYATAKFTDPAYVMASADFHQDKAWVYGYISAYNVWVDNLQSDRLKTLNMTFNDTLRWLGAWCRDNMSKGLNQGIQALFSK